MRTASEIVHFDENLVRGLLSSQFPNWAGLFLEAIEPQGHDNRTFRLGDDKSVRLPSGPAYAPHVVVEYRWLSELAPYLPVQIPEPLALGRPDQDFPWHWLVNRWLGGDDAATARVRDMVCFASDLAAFLRALQSVDAAGAPKPNADNFFQGGHLSVYDSDTIDRIGRLEGKIDAKAATETWSHALESEWNAPPVWVHGVAENTIYRWKAKFGGMDVSDAKKLRALEHVRPHRSLGKRPPAVFAASVAEKRLSKIALEPRSRPGATLAIPSPRNVNSLSTP